jgi:hypothetical protein
MISASRSRLRDGIGLSVVLFALASCGGGGGGGGSSAPPGSKLFVVDAGTHAIGSIINAAPTLNSTFNVDRIISGSLTGLGTAGGTPSVSSIPSVALDAANDRLFVATQNGGVVTFDSASMASGNTAFSRRVTGLIPPSAGGPRGVNFLYIDVDKTHDVLYSVDPNGEVHVYDGISQLNGLSLAPTRIITPDFGGAGVNNVFGIAIDVAKDLLYVGLQLNSTQSIAVFSNASTASTTTTPLAPTKTLTFSLGIGSICLDAANNRMYLSQFDAKVLVYDAFSALLSGAAPAADRTIDLTGGLLSTQFYIFVDKSRDKLYAVGNVPGATAAMDQGILLIIDNASTANDVPPGGPNASDGLGTNIGLANIRLSAVAVAP